MCRLLGVVFRRKFPTETLSELRTLSKTGEVPDEKRRGHRDGWGIASFRSGKPYYVARSVAPAFSDKRYDDAVAAVNKVPFPSIVIAHVRAASSGRVTIENTHPFIVNGLVFAHNGTVNGLPDHPGRQKGQTDSELIALMIADRFEEKGSLVSAVKSVVKEEIDERAFTAAILLASDGKTLVGYRDYTSSDRAAYYDLKMARCAESVALFQEIAVGCNGYLTEIEKREIVSVSLDLEITQSRL